MIVCDAREFVFFHIPKTGGTSVDFSLAPFFDCAPRLEARLRDYGCRLTPFWAGAEGRFHSNIDCPRPGWEDVSTDCLPCEHLLQAAPDMADRIRRYFVFTVVRNPYERAYSRYLMWQRYGQLPPGVDTLEKFLVHTRDKRGQLAYLPDLGEVDFIARTETLARDFRTLCSLLGLGHRPLPQVHVATPITGRYKYLARYTPEAIALVNARQGEEFRAFGYPMLAPDDFRRHIDDAPALAPVSLPNRAARGAHGDYAPGGR